MISKKISTRPQRDIAKAILHLGYDEGVAAGNKGAISGVRGIKNGVAWYPGILSSIGLRWMTPILEVAALALLKQKLK